MRTENVIDVMNRINENIAVSKLIYRSKMKRRYIKEK